MAEGNPLLSAKVEVIGEKIVQAKLLLAAPRILEQNKLMTVAMLDLIKPIVHENTPEGPGHFGYHGRDTLETDVRIVGTTGTVGVLRAAVQLYWREFGTGARFRKNKIKAEIAALVNSGNLGERAFMTAHKASSGVNRVIKFYYGGLAAWWKA